MKHLTLPHFTQKNLAGLSAKIENIVKNRLEQIEVGQSVDVAQLVTRHVPVDTIFHVLDLPYKDKEMLTRWAHDLTLILEPLQSSTDGIESVMKIFPETMLYLVEMVEARRANPKENDVVSDLLSGTIDGEPLTYEEIISTVGLLYMAGIETTVFFLSNALNALLASEEAREAWMSISRKAKSSGLPYYMDRAAVNAMDELMRFCGSVWMTARVNTEEFVYDVDGSTERVPRGSLINVFMAAANRDPRIFSDPHRLDLFRSNASKQVGFSAGPHYCLGSHLAKMEAIILFTELFERYPNMEIAQPPVWRHRMTFRGIENLVVRV
jgi:cytochrome P450